jgi:hypothetical protein
MLTRAGLRPLPPQARRASAACPTTTSRGEGEPWHATSAVLRPESRPQVTTGQKSLAGRGRSALHGDASRAPVDATRADHACTRCVRSP